MGLRTLALTCVEDAAELVAQWADCGATIDLKSHLRFPDVPPAARPDRAEAAAAAVLFTGPGSARTR